MVSSCLFCGDTDLLLSWLFSGLLGTSAGLLAPSGSVSPFCTCCTIYHITPCQNPLLEGHLSSGHMTSDRPSSNPCMLQERLSTFQSRSSCNNARDVPLSSFKFVNRPHRSIRSSPPTYCVHSEIAGYGHDTCGGGSDGGAGCNGGW